MGYGHRRGGRHHHDCGHHHHCGCGHGHHHHDEPEFDEKRVIDTIVDLVGERVERLLDTRREHEPRHRDGGGDEKRIVDLIVRLVSEHVREIVAEELDRRLGRPDTPAAGGESR